MSEQPDRAAWSALVDALADVAEIHAAAARVADEPALKSSLSSRADRLRQLASEAQGHTDRDDPGTAFQRLNAIALQVDSWFGDDDEAARDASSKARTDLLAVLDDRLRDPEISPETRSAFADIRERIANTREPTSGETGLRALPS